jgi:hypothetical protein
MTVASLISNSTLTITSTIPVPVHVTDVNGYFYLVPSAIDISVTSPEQYSLWDLQLGNWSASTLGQWYYYCPDLCGIPDSVENSWIPFTDGANASPPTSIPYVLFSLY